MKEYKQKEATTLINMRIPNSILKKFDENVASDNLVPSRTAKIINMMAAENVRYERRKK